MKSITKLLFVLFVICSHTTLAQEKLTIEGVRKAYLRNSGEILQDGTIKGYYVFYQSDKVDKKTNEYTVQITDQNLNKVKDIVFTDDKNVQLLESSYNGNTIMFLFYNSKESILEYRSYNFEGKVVSTYTKELDKRSKWLLESTYGSKSEDGQNEAIFDVEKVGYATVIPIREKKYYSYEVNFFFTDKKKQWAYEAVEDQEDKFNSAVYLGHTDELVILEVIKQKKLTASKDARAYILGLNINTGKKEFEVETNFGEYKMMPIALSAIPGKTDFMIMGTYYESGDKLAKDATEGMNIITMTNKGAILQKKFSSWQDDFGKFLDVDKKGRVGKSYIFIHKIVQTSDGKIFALGEGYKKSADGVGIALNVLGALAGGGGRSNNTKIVTTDFYMMQFDDKFALKDVKVYDKFNNSVALPLGADYLSPHSMALLIKSYNGFDYNFTQSDKNRSFFVSSYTDYEKSGDDKGLNFNTISYMGGKISHDKLKLITKSKYLRVFPAKPGYVMLMEYSRKEKRLDFRLEKVN